MLTFGVPNLCQSQQVFPDNFMRREILSLIVQCIYIELGCKWKGEVRHLEVRRFYLFPLGACWKELT